MKPEEAIMTIDKILFYGSAITSIAMIIVGKYMWAGIMAVFTYSVMTRISLNELRIKTNNVKDFEQKK